ncbi:MAG: hypothetical protein QME77_12640 [bacterium]|nr:hypothetical protein [bacterium]
MDRFIAAANSPGGRWARLIGGGLLVLAALRLRGQTGYLMALAGLAAAVPALWGACF